MDTRELTFGEHLEELRHHVGRAVLYVGLALFVCLFFQDELLSVVLWPQRRIAAEGRDDRFFEAAKELDAALAPLRGVDPMTLSPTARVEVGLRLERAIHKIQSGPDRRLSFLSPQEAFLNYLKIAFICALFLSSPLVVRELWRFVAAGLHEHEQRYVRIFAPLSFLCFAGGALFGYFTLIPISLYYLETYGSPELLTASITLDAYLDLFLGLTLAIGLMFELPIILAFLALIRVVSSARLREWRRYWVLAATVIAAVVTPTGDPITLGICTAPLLVLYEVGILVVQLLEKSLS